MKAAVHTVNSIESDKGGPSRTVPRLCRELASDGRWQPTLITTRPRPTGTTSLDVRGPLLGSFRRAIEAQLSTSAGGPRLLHDHGVWLRSNATAAMQAWRSGVPLVVSPRGMLEPWALGHRAWKKQLALALYQLPLLRTARGLHATSEEEATNLRALGLRQPIAVIANGVDVPALPALPASRLKPQRTALFLSRLNVKKGILPLLEAWSKVQPPGWRLQIVGPDEGGYATVVETAIDRLGLREQVQLLPEADDQAKWALYRDAELFVLPSFSENFGVVVAEALAAGLPVITTTGMPWAGTVSRQCGWRIEPTVAALQPVLQQATAMSPATLAEMGARGREWMVASYSWSAIGTAMATFYDWLVDGALPQTAPPFVRLSHHTPTP
jgi:glycosyltransferase involved in cell wall biosynthesis